MPNSPNQPRAGVADLREDLVCGMSVPADAPLRLEHADTTYVFCSTSGLQRFEDDPSAFLGRPEPADDADATPR
jgi:YHS domain-containing protein